MKPVALLCLITLLAGCSSIIDSSKDEPLSSDYSKRSLGRMLDDETIETRAMVNIRKADDALRDANVVVVSFNGVVLLAGQVPSADLRALAERTVADVRYVRKVHNELTIGEPNDFGARSNDSWITTRIKSKMLFSTKVDPAEVKVVTEDGVVYLLGHVDQRSADKAVDMARHTNGVTRVVRMFEYIE